MDPFLRYNNSGTVQQDQAGKFLLLKNNVKRGLFRSLAHQKAPQTADRRQWPGLGVAPARNALCQIYVFFHCQAGFVARRNVKQFGIPCFRSSFVHPDKYLRGEKFPVRSTAFPEGIYLGMTWLLSCLPKKKMQWPSTSHHFWGFLTCPCKPGAQMQKAPQQYNPCVMISSEAVSAADQAGQLDNYFFFTMKQCISIWNPVKLAYFRKPQIILVWKLFLRNHSVLGNLQPLKLKVNLAKLTVNEVARLCCADLSGKAPGGPLEVSVLPCGWEVCVARQSWAPRTCWCPAEPCASSAAASGFVPPVPGSTTLPKLFITAQLLEKAGMWFSLSATCCSTLSEE